MTSHGRSHTHSQGHPHAEPESETSSVMRIQRLAMFLEAHFGEVELHMPEAEDDQEQGEGDHEPSLLVRLDEADARIHLLSLTVSSANEALKKRVEAVLDMAVTTVSSLAESFQSGVPVASKDASLEKDVLQVPSHGREDVTKADEAMDELQKASASNLIDMKGDHADESDESDFELQVHD